MFCLLPAKCKQQQIALLIISFFLHVNGIRNEGSNMLLPQQQQSLHTTIENSNYQSASPSNSAFKPSPLLGFTLDDATLPHHFKPTYEDVKYPTNIPSTPSSAAASTTAIKEGIATKAETPNDNRRYSPTYTTNVAEQQFPFPNEQQQQGFEFMPQQQQSPSQYQYQYEQQPQRQQEQEQYFAQQLTETPIYIYKDPYTNENYHYTPTEASNVDAAAAATYTHNDYNGYGYKQQQQQPVPQRPYQPAAASQNNQEYLVHSSMIVGTHQQPSPYGSSDKDVYLKRPGLVYDESYSSHPNSVLEKKSESGPATKVNKISYDSHDYPPPSYHQQQTSNFLPTPVPDVPATPPPIRRPPVYATPPPPPVRQPPSYATSRPPPPPPQQDYRPRPPPPQQTGMFGHQQYLQSSQNALPNYANNLDNYLSNKQQTEYYRPERPPPAYLQQPQQQQFHETVPPPFRQQQLQQQQQQQYQQTPYDPYRPQQQQQPSPQAPSYPTYENPQYVPPRPPPARPSYNNYYDYQIGEVPPQTQGAFNYPYPRPPNGPNRPPPAPPTQQASGLATLVQYAPQFTSLLLGGGGSSSNSNSPLGSLLGALTGAGTTPQSSSSSSSSYNRRPVNTQLIRALENIARNDDLQCVPKVLCQMIAAQTERGQLPGFITSPTITNFLSGFPASSPALIYGRAALLGLSGGDKSCHHTYVKCPKNEIEIIYYLNNHRGGFFKFFSEPEPEQSFNQHNGNQESSQSGAASLFSILSALTGNQAEPVTTPRPRPKPPQPQPASSDITGTIGNFFTQLLSDYMGGGATVEYQRRRRRSADAKRVRFEDASPEEDAHLNFSQQTEEKYQDDEEDSEDTQKNVEFIYEPEYADDEDDRKGVTQSRVVHKPLTKGSRLKFFPETDVNEEDVNEGTKNDYTAIIEKFNEFNKGRKLKFPSATKERQYIDVANDYLREAKDLDLSNDNQQLNYGHQYTNYQEGTYDNANDSKNVSFYDDDQETAQSSLYQKQMNDLLTAESSHVGTKVKFPDREGKILHRPYYAASYSYNYLQQHQQQSYGATDDTFVVSNNQRPNDYSESETNAYEPYGSSLKSGEDDKLVLPNSQRPGHYLNQPQGSDDYNEFGQHQEPEEYNRFGQTARPEDYNRFVQPQIAGVYNTHVTSLNSISNYVSNSATNNNYYGGLPLKQPITNSNHFLPTPPPDGDNDANNDYNNSLYPNNNFNANSQNSHNRYSSSNSHKSQRYTASSNNNYNGQTFNTAYRPNSQSGNSYNSANIQGYPSNSNSNSLNNRYHSSLYTTRRTTTTPRPKNDNVYITNSRGETEYYIRPDGRKVYL